jgi:CopA family copper-resistance protein
MRLLKRGASASSRLTRRHFVQGIGGGALLWSGLQGWAQNEQRSRPAELIGPEFDLEIGTTPVSFTGLPRIATTVNDRVPAPLLRWREGDEVIIRVHNRLPVASSIHWHGVIVPADMDGVPGLSFHGIAARSTFTYRFKVNQSGTYWYHAHSRFQEQTGLYGPIVIEPRAGERHRVDRDYVLLLSDWSDEDPARIYRKLKIQSNYYNAHQRTAQDFARDVEEQGLKSTMADRRMWAQMRMNPTDLADVSGQTYTYLMNGATPEGNWTGVFQRGEKVRLRVINGSSMSIFDVRIPGLKLTVVAADGQDVEPVTVDEFRIAAAEVYDLIVEPKDDRAYTIFAQSIDRTGYVRGTLAPRAGMEAEVPALDPLVLLTMSDMGMSHGMGGAHGAHGAAGEHSAHDMAGTQGATGEHSAHDMANMQGPSGEHSAHSAAGASQSPHHAPAEFGPNVDSLADQPNNRLDDPGIGLRNNGRRVLTYADLHTIGGPIDKREPSRDIELHLTGHMERFVWSFSGQKFSEATPLRFNYGERLRIVLVNDSMMTHPIHLHGMWSEVETPEGEFLVRKHTVMVQPGQRVSYAVTADALGRWAYHCHLLYHMEAGMFREVHVARSEEHSS